MILSKTDALKQFFYKGVLYTDNNSKSIAKAMNVAVAEIDNLSKDVSELKNEIENTWQNNASKFKKKFGG